jgi:hypothetical protein
MGKVIILTTYIAIIGVASCFTTPSRTDSTASGDQAEKRNIEIRLDYRPFTDPDSTFVLLQGNGQLQVVRYSTYRLVVLSASRSTLSEPKMVELLAKTQESAFKNALRQKSFAGAGLSQGDQFQLSLTGQGAVAGDIFGFIDDAPEVVRGLVSGLLTSSKQSDKLPLAEAYVRGRPIEKDRYDKLRREGKLRFISITDLPSDLQPIVSRAAGRPGDFHPLSRTQYNQLLALASHGHDFFVVENNLGHQLTLYEAGK